MNNLTKTAARFMKRNASLMLTIGGSVGVIGTAVVAAKATPKALILLEKAKEEKREELTKLETVKIAGPAYIPAALIGVSTIACIFGAHVFNKKQQAALISAYALANQMHKEYKDKVIDIYGEEGERLIHEELAKDAYDERDEEYGDEDDGKNLFYDEISKRYFRATNETVLTAEYKINREISMHGYASVNEFYDLLGIDPIPNGDNIGWNSSQLYDTYWNDWVDFHHHKVTMDDGLECWIIETTDPELDFNEY